MKKLLFLLAGINLVLLSCKKTEVTPENRGTLIEIKWVGSISKSEVKDYIN